MAKINPKLAAALPAPTAAQAQPMVTRAFRGKLTSDMIPLVERALLQGLPLEIVGDLIGVRGKTLKRWIDEGAEETCEDPVKIELSATAVRARAQTNLEFVHNFKAIAMKDEHPDWRPLHIVAKAFDRDLWGDKKEVKLEAKIEAKPTHKDLSGLTDEEFEQYRALEEKISAGKK